MESMKICDVRVVGININGRIKDFELSVLPNEHAKAYVAYEIPYLQYSERDVLELSERKIVFLYDDNILFAGKCQEFSIKRDPVNRLDELNIKMISLTIESDKKKKKRSFQNCAESYEQIMKQVLKEENTVIDYQDKTIYSSAPLIQYEETAWEFVRRMTSRMHSVMYPGYKETDSHISVGIKMPEIYRKIEVLGCKKVFCEIFWHRRDCETEFLKDDFVCYDITSYENFDIGNGIVLDNKNLIILEKKMYFSKGEVLFRYRVGRLPAVMLWRYDNQNFSGMSIQGEVLSATNETVRLKFNFDKEQDISTAYDYQWVPETGNVMYLMPQVGTVVNLYFKNAGEESAIAVSCIRKNGNTHNKLSNCNERFLTNEIGKQMLLKEKSIGFINEISEEGILLNDGLFISASSKKCISLVSSGKLKMEAVKIYIETPNEIILKKIRL